MAWQDEVFEKLTKSNFKWEIAKVVGKLNSGPHKSQY
ncbi:uncharacterized protein G2W53_021778 [Senna tora]|uniref:Uncharacterized protein n=1 Tax=Senna tora TaxID=362788 RepID=A0A834TTE4_9FABA|nr:uncharacterized protein G2W53_021778 [Senna tora]